jgi:spermidine synthase
MTRIRRGFTVLLALALEAGVGLTACSTPPGPPAPESPMRVLEVADGRHGRIEVLEHRGSLALAIDGVFQTVVPAAPLGISRGILLRAGDHVELVPWLRPGAQSALLIGLGGGLHARALELYGIAVIAVEIEPEVVRIARERFGVTCEVAIGDGRDFLERDARRFDAVILDAFAGADLPEHLFTREAFAAIASRLGPGGILAVHLMGSPEHPAIRAVARTIEAVFPHLLSTRAGRSCEAQAVYIFASPAPLGLGPWVRAELDRLGFTGREIFEIDTAGSPVLTDSQSHLSALARDIVEEHARFSLEIRRNPPW